VHQPVIGKKKKKCVRSDGDVHVLSRGKSDRSVKRGERGSAGKGNSEEAGSSP